MDYVNPTGGNGSFVANWDESTPIKIRQVEYDSTQHPEGLKGNWLVNDAGTELQFFYESGLTNTGLSPMADAVQTFTGTF